MNPRPSGIKTINWFANRTFFGLTFGSSAYQAELPAHSAEPDILPG